MNGSAINDESITELINTIGSAIDSIKNSTSDINKNSAKLPGTIEIMMTGINGETALTSIFSPQIDKLLTKLFDLVMSGDFEKILAYEDEITAISNAIFGEGSFKGPVSRRVLNSIQNTMTSYKYATTKSFLGKTMTNMKKMSLVMKNLKKEEKKIDNPEELEKYRKAVYAIKKVLKMAAKVYSARKEVNDQVLAGIKNIVHEESSAE